MRLGIKLLNTSATLNQFRSVDQIRISQGETVDLFFQLVDLDQGGLRYIPAPGAAVQVQIPRSPEVIAITTNNTRQVVDPTVNRAAGNPFSEDRSIWMISLIDLDTAQMVSNSLRITLSEGTSTKIAFVNQAIKMIDHQDQ